MSNYRPNSALAILMALTAASCAPRAIPVPGVPTAPKQSVAVAPTVEAVRRDTTAANQAASKLEAQVTGLAKNTQDLRQGLSTALAEAQRLKAQKTASEKEIAGLWQMLASSDTKVRNLFEEAEAARDAAHQHMGMRLAAEANLEHLARDAASRDAEVESLRLQRDDMAAVVKAQKASLEELSADYQKATKRAAIGDYLNAWVITGACALFLLIIGWCVIKVCRPAWLSR